MSSNDSTPHVVHHHFHFFPDGSSGGGQREAPGWVQTEPPVPPAHAGAGSASYVEDAPVAQPSAQPWYAAQATPGSSNRAAWVWDVVEVVAGLAIIAFIAVLVFVAGRWLVDYGQDDHSTPTPVVATMTMPELLKSEGFAVNGHSLCHVYVVNNGESYRLELNRGRGCQHYVQTVVPVGSVHVFSTGFIRSNTVDLGYANDKYIVGSTRLAAIRRQSLGDQLSNNLRVVTLRLTPDAYKAFKALPQS